MAGAPKPNRDTSQARSQRGTEESGAVKWFLIAVALAFCVVFLLLPLLNVVDKKEGF